MIYAIYAIATLILITVDAQFIDGLLTEATADEELADETGGIGSPIDRDQVQGVFTLLTYNIAIAAGLMIGQIKNTSLLTGVKYALILVSISYVFGVEIISIVLFIVKHSYTI